MRKFTVALRKNDSKSIQFLVNINEQSMYRSCMNVPKQKVAEYHGYEVLVIWDSEYKSDKEGTIQKCLDFLQK